MDFVNDESDRKEKRRGAFREENVEHNAIYQRLKTEILLLPCA